VWPHFRLVLRPFERRSLVCVLSRCAALRSLRVLPARLSLGSSTASAASGLLPHHSFLSRSRQHATHAMQSPQQAYDSTVSLQSLESLIAPLRYVDKARVARDVLGLIRNSNSLTFKIGTLVHPNGSSETLLQLLGTTPIYYKGAAYNIPVNLWVVEQYPHRPPTCYVTPTKDMRIKDGHLHVDHFGMIYLPYLNQWNAQNSNLLEMVTMMSSVFSTDPPVFKVPINAAGAASPNQQQKQQPQQQPQQQQPQQQQYNQQSPYAASNPYSQPLAGNAGYPGAQQQQQQPIRQASPSNSINSVSSMSSSVASPSPLAISQPPQDPRATRKNQLISQLTTKLRQQLQDDLSLKTLLMDDLLANQQQLESHSRAIQDRLSSLTTEVQQLDQSNAMLTKKNDEMQKWLAQNEQREVVEVDKLCYVKDTWSKQLLENVSLDAALEDAYYLLDRALADDRMDLQMYTKQIRNLSRKQFYARYVRTLRGAQCRSQPSEVVVSRADADCCCCAWLLSLCLGPSSHRSRRISSRTAGCRGSCSAPRVIATETRNFLKTFLLVEMCVDGRHNSPEHVSSLSLSMYGIVARWLCWVVPCRRFLA
jgi:ESCRT-I complex subunit TSG101